MSTHISPALAERRAPARRGNGYGVAAVGQVQMPLEGIDELRQKLGPPGQPPFAPAVLKASDEQTVVGIAALLQAMGHCGLRTEDLTEWGILAAPRFFGRIGAAEMIHKFEITNGWKLSPLFIPHRSLHAISGTVSQALRIKGPNYGVGGGRNHVVEGLLAALTELEDGSLPGLFVLLSRCDPEPQMDREGKLLNQVACQAIALAFMPVAEGWRGLRLSLAESASAPSDIYRDAGDIFPSLYRFFEERSEADRQGTWASPLRWDHEMRLSDDA
jgi:hypothetical protein